MIQRVVRNGRVRAFGAEWEPWENSRDIPPEGQRVDVKAYADGSLYMWWDDDGRGVQLICGATRRPVVDLAAKADQ